jgi:hypothetical protein
VIIIPEIPLCPLASFSSVGSPKITVSHFRLRSLA